MEKKSKRAKRKVERVIQRDVMMEKLIFKELFFKDKLNREKQKVPTVDCSIQCDLYSDASLSSTQPLNVFYHVSTQDYEPEPPVHDHEIIKGIKSDGLMEAFQKLRLASRQQFFEEAFEGKLSAETLFIPEKAANLEKILKSHNI